MTREWQTFVLAHGWKAEGYHLAAVLDQPLQEVVRFRAGGACTRLPKAKGFVELFTLWHGRAPRDADWPTPRKRRDGRYEWQAPEIALLASLVGRLGNAEIAQVLTKRLRQVTGDRRAARSRAAVQIRNCLIGLQSHDFVGGITTSQAGREIGNINAINQAIARGRGLERLRPVRVGWYWMIPHGEWARWKATRVFPPKGYVQLASIRERLGLTSDAKLPFYAGKGYIPTAIRCNVYGTKIRTTRFGTWFIDAKVARKLLADRRAGRPMPWYGKPMDDNLRATFKLWRERKHPPECEICARAWGKQGAPATFDEYQVRYPPLTLGAKRHLTRKWLPGLTPPAVARLCGTHYSRVQRAVETGALEARQYRGRRYVTMAAATQWKHRKCPTGSSRFSWVSLATARKQYLFTPSELRAFIAAGELRTKVGTDGAMRGITYVLRHQCGALRAKLGFTEEEAARRAGVSVARLRTLLKGVDLHGQKSIPLQSVHAVIHRIKSREGYTLEEAAAKLGVPVAWVCARKADGTIRVTRARWDRRRVYITAPMLERLCNAKRRRLVRERLGPSWLLLNDAAILAGVCSTTVVRWCDEGAVKRRRSPTGYRYLRSSVRARARRYWKTCRFHRASPPAWLRAGAPQENP